VTGTIVAVDVVGPTGEGIAAGEYTKLARAILNGITMATRTRVDSPAARSAGRFVARTLLEPDRKSAAGVSADLPLLPFA